MGLFLIEGVDTSAEVNICASDFTEIRINLGHCHVHVHTLWSRWGGLCRKGF